MDNGRNFYRRNALSRMLTPKRRGELPRPFRQRDLLAFAALAAVIVGGVLWSVFGRINEYIYGSGLLTLHSQYNVISSPGEGAVVSLDVEVGDEVEIGQMVGRIFSNDDLESLFNSSRRLAMLRKDFEQLKRLADKLHKVRQSHYEVKSRQLEEAITRISKQLEWYQVFIDDMRRLSKRGAVSQLSSYNAHQDFNAQTTLESEYRTDIVAAQISFEEADFMLEKELREYEESLSQAVFDVEQRLREIQYRSRIISYNRGTVTNVNVSDGDRVPRGMELVRLSDRNDADGGIWKLTAYFSAADARKVRIGMRTVVTPSTVVAERDGAILGIVTRVGSELQTPESLARIYRNPAFSEAIFGRCGKMPVEVEIMLSRDSSNPSKFSWTSGRGPDVELISGTLCSAGVAIRANPPIELFFANLRRFLFGMGTMEEHTIAGENADAGL